MFSLIRRTTMLVHLPNLSRPWAGLRASEEKAAVEFSLNLIRRKWKTKLRVIKKSLTLPNSVQKQLLPTNPPCPNDLAAVEFSLIRRRTANLRLLSNLPDNLSRPWAGLRASEDRAAVEFSLIRRNLLLLLKKKTDLWLNPIRVPRKILSLHKRQITNRIWNAFLDRLTMLLTKSTSSKIHTIFQLKVMKLKSRLNRNERSLSLALASLSKFIYFY